MLVPVEKCELQSVLLWRSLACGSCSGSFVGQADLSVLPISEEKPQVAGKLGAKGDLPFIRLPHP